MGIPYYLYTTCKDGSFKLGVSLSEFKDLVDNGDIEVSYRGGKTLLVNNDTLNNYIAKYGGKKDKYRKYLRLLVHLLQESEITKMHALIKKSELRVKNISHSNLSYHKFNAQDIINFFNIIKIKKN